MIVLNLTLNLRVPSFVWRKIVSVLSDLIAEVDNEATLALARVSGDVAKLQAKIDELEAKSDSPTPADLAALQALKAKIAAIDPTNPAVVPTPAPVDPSVPTPAQ